MSILAAIRREEKKVKKQLAKLAPFHRVARIRPSVLFPSRAGTAVRTAKCCFGEGRLHSGRREVVLT